MEMSQHKKLSQIMTELDALTAEEIDLVLAHQAAQGGRFGEAARELGLVDEAMVASPLSTSARANRLELPSPRTAERSSAA